MLGPFEIAYNSYGAATPRLSDATGALPGDSCDGEDCLCQSRVYNISCVHMANFVLDISLDYELPYEHLLR